MGGDALASLASARESAADGDLQAAHAQVAELFGRFPDNITVGAFLQELQVRLLVEPADPSEGSQLDYAAGRERRALALSRLWRERAEEQPTCANLVLAARMERDAPSTRHLLGLALAADETCAWAHYGLAHVAAREGDWKQVALELERVFAIEPGQPRARRLQAAALARAGRPERAIAALERWFDEVADEPWVEPQLAEGARLDLAALWLERGKTGKARAALEDADRGRDPARYLAILAALEQADGRPDRALAAAREAESRGPGQLTPIEQQALLHDVWFGDPVSAKHAWERLQVAAAQSAELSTRLRSMRAQIEIERLGERIAAEPAPAEPALAGGVGAP